MSLKPIIAGGFYNSGGGGAGGDMLASVYDPAGIAAQLAGRTVANDFSANGAASAPGLLLSGTIFSGGTGTTNFPHFLIQPTGATASTSWNTSGTALGVNLNVDAGNIFDFATDGASRLRLGAGVNASLSWPGGTNNPSIFTSNGNLGIGFFLTNPVAAVTGANFCLAINGSSASSSLAFSSGDPTNAGTHDAFLRRREAASFQLGLLHATVPTAQFLSAHDVTTGTGADLWLTGGRGSVAGGKVILGVSATNGAPTAQLTFHPSGVVEWDVEPSVDAAVVSTHSVLMTFRNVVYKVLLATP